MTTTDTTDGRKKASDEEHTFGEGDLVRVHPEFGEGRTLRVETISTYDDSVVLRNNVGETRYLRRVDGRRYIHSGAALGQGGFKRSKAIRVEGVEVHE